VRIGVQAQLADKAGDSSMRKAQKDALIEYYLVPDQPLLWVDDNGLTDAPSPSSPRSARPTITASPPPTTSCPMPPASTPSISSRETGSPMPR
jgi:hypothetical protein